MDLCKSCGSRVPHTSNFECRVLAAARDARPIALRQGKRYFDATDLKKALELAAEGRARAVTLGN